MDKLHIGAVTQSQATAATALWQQLDDLENLFQKYSTNTAQAKSVADFTACRHSLKKNFGFHMAYANAEKLAPALEDSYNRCVRNDKNRWDVIRAKIRRDETPQEAGRLIDKLGNVLANVGMAIDKLEREMQKGAELIPRKDIK